MVTLHTFTAFRSQNASLRREERHQIHAAPAVPRCLIATPRSRPWKALHYRPCRLGEAKPGPALGRGLLASPCRLRQADQGGPRLCGGTNSGWKEDAEGLFPQQQVNPLRVDTRQAPGSRRGAGEVRCIKPDGLRVIAVHMRADFGLGGQQGEGVTDWEQEVVRWQVDDAATPANEMGVGELQLVKGEVGKASVTLGGGVAGQKAGPHGRACAWSNLPDQGQPPASQGIAKAIRGIEQQACAGVPGQIARVPRQLRKQEDGGSVGLGCGQDQRSVRMPRLIVQGGKGALEGRAQDVARGGGRLERGRGRRGLGGIGGHARTMKIVWVAVSRHNMVGAGGICHN
jgi:hypothetical protein